MNLFRAYDIRGIYGKELTDEKARKLGKALGTFLKGNKTVCIGFDTRPSSPDLFDSFASGLLSTGCNVISLGMVPNPVAYFFAWKNKMFGCYITASHNPVEWNGIKLFKPNGVSFTEELEILRNVFSSGKFLKGKGEMEEREAINDYTNFLRERIGKIRGRIVVDFLGGSGTALTKAFREIGVDIKALHEKPDPSLYGFHRLEPMGDLIYSLSESIKDGKFDFGVALDCDADRAVFIDSHGNPIDSSVMCAIFIKEILKEKKGGKVVLTHDCASELDEFTRRLGGRVIRCRIGHNFVEQKVVEEKAVFGGEQSSHYYFSFFYPFSDGMLSTLYLCKILSETGKRLDELAQSISFHPIARVYINAKTDEKKFKVIQRIRKSYSKAIDVADGIKIKLNDIEWILIRASHTLPEINLCVEAKNEQRLKELIHKYSKLIRGEIKAS